jgi:phosphatidate cytidylyltransferase
MVGAGLVVALVVAYAAGSKGLVVLATAVCVLAAAEAFRMVQGAGFSPATLIGLVATAGTVLGAYWKGSEGVVVVAGLTFAGTILWYVLGVVEARPLVNVAVTVMIYFWVGLLGAFSALLLRQANGKGEFVGVVLVAVAADIAAYFVGRAVGSRPLAPAISPNKTIEGYLGGVIGAIIVGAVVGKALTPWGGMRHGLVLGLLVGLIAPAGDLFESLLKRDLQLKDSGTLLGGHGGVLDRFDSLLLALPAAYFVVLFFKL